MAMLSESYLTRGPREYLSKWRGKIPSWLFTSRSLILSRPLIVSKKPTGRGMSFHDLSSMITEIRSTIPRVQLIQSTSYKTDLSHRSTTKTAHRTHLQPTAYHICEISSLKPEAIALIPLLGHAEIKQKNSSNVVIPRSS